jgi:hypothetical protein
MRSFSFFWIFLSVPEVPTGVLSRFVERASNRAPALSGAPPPSLRRVVQEINAALLQQNVRNKQYRKFRRWRTP